MDTTEERRQYFREAAKKFRQRHPDAHKKWIEEHPTYMAKWKQDHNRKTYLYKCTLCDKIFNQKARHEKTKLHKTNILKAGTIEPNNIYCSIMEPIRSVAKSL